MTKDYSERVALITGPTSGLGKGIALDLAARGFKLVLLGRSKQKLDVLATECVDAGASKPMLLVCDMSSQRQVRAAANEFIESGSKLHVLVNNAGVVNHKHGLSEDGLEQTLAVAYWSAYLLTMLLLPTMEDSAPATIINTASDTYPKGDVPYEDPAWSKKYFMLGPYAAAKKANVMLTLNLAELLKPEKVSVNVYNPGMIYTGIVSQHKGRFTGIADWIYKKVSRPVSFGIKAPVELATAEDLSQITGQFYNYNKQTPVKADVVAESKEKAIQLWELSQTHTNSPAPNFVAKRYLELFS